jgi:hypothetical protein
VDAAQARDGHRPDRRRPVGRRSSFPSWLRELPYEHGLNHIYAMLVDGADADQRDELDGELWSDPVRERKMMAAIGR